MNYWLMKCEPSAYTIEKLARDGTTSWEGVRNYQARNFLRDEMKKGDRVLFYASNADPSGVTGVGLSIRKPRRTRQRWWSRAERRWRGGLTLAPSFATSVR